MNFIVRYAQPIDLTPLSQLYYDSYQSDHPDEEPPALEKAIIHLLHHEEDGVQFVIESSDQLIGFVTVLFLLDPYRLKNSAWFQDLYLIPEERREELEKYVVYKICELLRKRGIVQFYHQQPKLSTASFS